MHLIGNMLYLWVFGDNVEDAMGHARFVAFYLICGIAAALAHTLADPASQIPTIGASGAVSGVLGAYLLLHPKARVLVPIWIVPVYLPAFVLLIFWFAFQIVFAATSEAGAPGVAWWAHIGGFLAGALMALALRSDARDRELVVAVQPVRTRRAQPWERPGHVNGKRYTSRSAPREE